MTKFIRLSGYMSVVIQANNLQIDQFFQHLIHPNITVIIKYYAC